MRGVRQPSGTSSARGCHRGTLAPSAGACGSAARRRVHRTLSRLHHRSDGWRPLRPLASPPSPPPFRRVGAREGGEGATAGGPRAETGGRSREERAGGSAGRESGEEVAAAGCARDGGLAQLPPQDQDMIRGSRHGRGATATAAKPPDDGGAREAARRRRRAAAFGRGKRARAPREGNRGMLRSPPSQRNGYLPLQRRVFFCSPH